MTSINSLISLQHRRAVVTGALGGLGRVISSTLAELGANLILVDKTSSKPHDFIQQLQESYGVYVDYFSCDLESEHDRKSCTETILTFNRLDILVNNAAFVGSTDLTGWSVPFQNQSLSTWRRAIEVNLTAPFHLCQALSPLLKESDCASIINVGSIYGEYAPDWSLYDGTSMSNPCAYSSSKAGLIQMTRWLSTTLAPNVRVNAISPGGIYRSQNPLFVERYNTRTPLNRMAVEDDFRGVVTFLAGDMSSYITGQNIYVDGGWGVW